MRQCCPSDPEWFQNLTPMLQITIGKIAGAVQRAEQMAEGTSIVCVSCLAWWFPWVLAESSFPKRNTVIHSRNRPIPWNLWKNWVLKQRISFLVWGRAGISVHSINQACLVEWGQSQLCLLVVVEHCDCFLLFSFAQVWSFALDQKLPVFYSIWIQQICSPF